MKPWVRWPLPVRDADTMRAALWFLVLFGLAVAIALFAGNNQGAVTLFWPPYRVDLSLNLVLLGLVAGFLLVHLALRALSALFDLPRQAVRWRRQQKGRAMTSALLDALSQLTAGRFLRARKSAEVALVQARAMAADAGKPADVARFKALAHMVAAEAAHSLQDKPARDEHLKQALAQAGPSASAGGVEEVHEGALLRAARWALHDGDPATAMRWLTDLPQGAARRTVALRTRLKATRQSEQFGAALETARLLTKHRAFSPLAARSILRGLATDLLNGAHDASQLRRTWEGLDPSERQMPELAIHAAHRLVVLGGDAVLARNWLMPAWTGQESLSDVMRVRLVQTLEEGLATIDTGWLARIEAAHQANPRDASLQYLAGMACMQHKLWGKAQQLLTQATRNIKDPVLRRNAWGALAQLAEERGDAAAASAAWKHAARD
jgi:HemY protein